MSWLSKGLKKAERAISSAIPHQHSAQKRAELAAAKEQMDLYKEQKEQLKSEADRVSKERETETRKLHEKQIRSLRSRFRSPGFMEGPNLSESDTLG